MGGALSVVIVVTIPAIVATIGNGVADRSVGWQTFGNIAGALETAMRVGLGIDGESCPGALRRHGRITCTCGMPPAWQRW